LCDLSKSCDDGNGECSYLHAFRLALQIIISLQALPDFDIFVSPGEADSELTPVPVFARHRPRAAPGRYVLLPQEWQMHPHQSRKHSYLAYSRASGRTWETRTDTLIWRGQPSTCMWHRALEAAARDEPPPDTELNCTTWTLDNFFHSPRGILVFMSQFVQNLDAKFSGKSHVTDELWQMFQNHGMTASWEPSSAYYDAQFQSKYVIDMMGTADGDRKYWLLLGRSTLLVHENPFISWLMSSGPNGKDGALRPFEHYVPVNFDLRNLESLLVGLSHHDGEARRIGEAGASFALRHLTYDGVLLYVARLVQKYVTQHLA